MSWPTALVVSVVVFCTTLLVIGLMLMAYFHNAR